MCWNAESLKQKKVINAEIAEILKAEMNFKK